MHSAKARYTQSGDTVTGSAASASRARLAQNVRGPSDSSCRSSAWLCTSHFANTRFNADLAVLREIPIAAAESPSDLPVKSELVSRASAAVRP